MILLHMEENTSLRPQPELHLRHLTGINAQTGDFPPELFGQVRQALVMGMDQLASHGMGAENVTRIIFMLHDTTGFATCFPLLNDLFGRTCPATTLRLVKPFEQPGQLVGIELLATAGANDTEA
ncbi:endoribonuclease L-PSP [Komagataeibacter xylinus]|nr:endoribonuclease L-PSP [Komagataeibacter xylinus]